MSGIDEQIWFASECPKCGNCKEWFIGRHMWLYTKKAARKRGFKYPLLAHTDKPKEDELETFYQCNTCHIKVASDSVLGVELTMLFFNQKGKYFHRFLYNPEQVVRWLE